MSVPTLSGSQTTLRPMTHDDMPLLMRWGSDPTFRHYQWGQKPGVFDESNARAWIERLSRRGDSACWVIEHEGRLRLVEAKWVETTKSERILAPPPSIGAPAGRHGPTPSPRNPLSN